MPGQSRRTTGSRWDLAYSEQENRHLGDAVEAAGGEVLMDHRVRRGGSHHQKVVILRHPDVDGRLSLPPNQVGREQALALCRKAGRRSRDRRSGTW